MIHFKGRTFFTIFFIVILPLLILIYYIYSNEESKVPLKKKSPANLKLDEAYELSYLTENPMHMRKDIVAEKLAAQSKNIHEGSSIQENSPPPLFNGHRIVHLDLKGAPPILDYYKYLLKLFKDLGATGILMEYEDMFPFEGKIGGISAGNSYSKSDIQAIQSIAKDNDLIVIPLIQTFGHLEFILKLESYKDLREVARYPQVICPTKNATLPLLYEMIDQVVAAHADLKYLHIGADEVYYIGECPKCLEEMTRQRWNKKELFLAHVTRVTRYIKSKYPQLTILMWDDEFRDIPPEEIVDSGLHKLVEPVVWKYTPNPALTLVDQIWESYASVWPAVWIATAFKGATEPDRYYTDISYHLENHQRWLEIIDRYSKKIKFTGAILTGWQRYDHFSVLCELLASALPSLAVNLAVLQAPNLNNFPSQLPARVADILQCDSSISLTIPEPQYGWTKCGFQGAAVYSTALRLYSLTQDITRMEQDNTFKGWLKPYNIKHLFSNPSHVEQAVVELDRLKMELVYVEKEMRTAMAGIYDDYTLTEWIETFVVPLNEKVDNLWEAKQKILEKNSWPRRPLRNNDL